MKRVLAAWMLVVGFLVQSSAVGESFAFSSSPAFSEQWKQVTSGYYQPLGKLEMTAGGLNMEARPETPVFVEQKRRFDLREGDRLEISVTLDSKTGGTFYLSVFEYGRRGWQTNSTVNFWMEKGEQTVTREVTVKPAKAPVVEGSLAFGPAGGHQALVKRISYRFLSRNYSPAHKVELPAGLAVHLDGSSLRSLECEGEKLVLWHDQSGNGLDVKAAPGQAPVVIRKGVNGLPMVRFSGKEWLTSSRKMVFPQGISVFVVFRRGFEQGQGEAWQDSLYWGGTGDPDNTGTYHLTMGANKGEEKPQLFMNMKKVPVNAPLMVGSNAGVRGFLHGDIGEILVFDRMDFQPQDIEKIRGYLLEKWKIQEDDYVRMGPLPPAPKRISDRLPLSDQQNKGKWRLVEKVSDEFEGTELDRSKWTDQLFYTIGLAPMRYLPDNLKIKDGMAQITNIYDPSMPSGRLSPRDPEYHSFSSGLLYSAFMVRYGYLEVRTKIQATSFNNAFWLIGAGIERKTGRKLVPEIDVYELAGKSFAHTYKYNMALHLVQREPTWKHKAFGKGWTSNFKFCDDFHVYGLEWTPKVIRYFIDGALVREFKVKENYWDVPMTVHFNTPPHFDWFGVPHPDDFPCTYYIDYFRFWKNPETDVPEDDWKAKYKPAHKPVLTGFAYDYYKKYGNRIVPKPNAKPAPAISHDLVTMTAAEGAGWKAAFDGKAQYLEQAAPKKPGVRLTFPPMLSRKDSGEVQYAAPFGRWPKVELTAPALKITDWSPYQYLAVDFHNPNRGIEALTVVVETEKGQKQQKPMLFKSGEGVYYWPLPAALKQANIKNVTFNVRGTDRKVVVDILGLRLER